jgi:hypothetical protein
MYYDDEETEIENLSTYLSVKVTYEGEKACSDAVIVKKDQVRSKYEIAFKDEDGSVSGTADYAEPTNSDNSFANRATARKKTTTDQPVMDNTMTDAGQWYNGKWAHLYIDRPLEVKRENETHFEQCEYQFRLYALDNNEWKQWDDLANELQKDTNIDLISSIYVEP